MQHVIRIAGPAVPMRRLGDIAGLDVERTSARRLEGDRWQVSGYATDEALIELEARGLSVESVLDAVALEAQRTQLYAQIEPDPDGAPDIGDANDGTPRAPGPGAGEGEA